MKILKAESGKLKAEVKKTWRKAEGGRQKRNFSAEGGKRNEKIGKKWSYFVVKSF